MSNENNNGVIDFDSSTFISGSVDNASSDNTVSPDNASGSMTSNINVDDIFGTWDNSSSSTQSDVKPVSNDYNNSSVDVSKESIISETSNAMPSDTFDIFGTDTSDNQVQDTSAASKGGVELAMDNSELAELAMNAFAGLTSNGVSLENQEQETSSTNNVISKDTVAFDALKQASNASEPEIPATFEAVNVSVENVQKQAVPSYENQDYMAAFANPFASLNENQSQVSQTQIKTTPVNSESNGLESQNPNSVVAYGQDNFISDNAVQQVASTDVPNLANPGLENVDVANPTNVVGDFNGFSDTNNNLANNGVENDDSNVNSIAINPNVLSENGGVAADLDNPDSSDITTTFDNQPNITVNTEPPVAPLLKQDVEGNQVEANANTIVEPIAADLGNVVSQDFNNGNIVNPDMGTFDAQSNVTPQVEVPNTSDVQTIDNGLTSTVQVPTDFNGGFNQEISNQRDVNNPLNNQVVSTDNNVGAVSSNGGEDSNVISPEATTNLQQALSTPVNNVALDNSISVGSIPNGQVATPVVTDNNQESTQVPPKKQGKVSLPVVMLIIITVFSVGIIILRRNELMEFFQTLIKK